MRAIGYSAAAAVSLGLYFEVGQGIFLTIVVLGTALAVVEVKRSTAETERPIERRSGDLPDRRPDPEGEP